jgi:hypothetical protein
MSCPFTQGQAVSYNNDIQVKKRELYVAISYLENICCTQKGLLCVPVSNDLKKTKKYYLTRYLIC